MTTQQEVDHALEIIDAEANELRAIAHLKSKRARDKGVRAIVERIGEKPVRMHIEFLRTGNPAFMFDQLARFLPEYGTEGGWATQFPDAR